MALSNTEERVPEPTTSRCCTAFVYHRFCYDCFKQLLRRQKMAYMILENGWYEAEAIHEIPACSIKVIKE